MTITTIGAARCSRPCDFRRVAPKDARGNPVETRGNSDVNPEQNLRAAQSTFSGFVTMVKWGTIASVLVAALVILLISR